MKVRFYLRSGSILDVDGVREVTTRYEKASGQLLSYELVYDVVDAHGRSRGVTGHPFYINVPQIDAIVRMGNGR